MCSNADYRSADGFRIICTFCLRHIQFPLLGGGAVGCVVAGAGLIANPFSLNPPYTTLPGVITYIAIPNTNKALIVR
jgi:hypothetical protein